MFSFSVGVPSTSAIPDYPTLKTTINDWLDRDDLTAKVPMFVQMAEAMFNRELRTPEMETSANITFTSGSANLPSDYLAMRSAYVSGSPDTPLRGMAPTATYEEFDGTSGTPVAYVLVNGGMTLIPPPSATTTVTLSYFARIEGLTDANESNWLLEKHPDLYWAATIAYAYDYLDNDAKSQKYFAYTTTVLEQIKESAKKDRFGAGPLVPNSVAQVGSIRC